MIARNPPEKLDSARVLFRFLWCLLILLADVAFSDDCLSHLKGDTIRISELEVDDYLLLENSEKEFGHRLDRMDTANCFIFVLEKGSRLVGKLTKKDGYGASRYGFRIGMRAGPLSMGSLSEIVEFRPDISKTVSKRKRREVAETGGRALIIVLSGAVAIVFLGLIGAGMAGGK